MAGPSADIIQARIARRLCIWCGIHPAIDRPYVCPDCQRQIADDQRKQQEKNTHER